MGRGIQERRLKISIDFAKRKSSNQLGFHFPLASTDDNCWSAVRLSVTVRFTGAMAGREIVARVENGNLSIGPANGQA